MEAERQAASRSARGYGCSRITAKRYEGPVKDGGSVLSAHCDKSEQFDMAKEAFRDSGARDISSAGESASEDKSEARETNGNISVRDTDLEPVSDRVRAEAAVAEDRR